ncbi:MFS transporter [Mesorhizobium sp. M0854]|uniref:MFS transporter n=1 Tax=Mesorhizobium sp. M0854 TaxID=2957013 RepID=UPI00333AF810
MAKRTSSLVPFEHKTFRSIWSAALISNLGTLVEGAAAAWLMTSIAAVIFDRPSCCVPALCLAQVVTNGCRSLEDALKTHAAIFQHA